jgi:hypothetical protein
MQDRGEVLIMHLGTTLELGRRHIKDGISISTSGDDQHVILMLIVSQDNQTRLLWYDWDSSTSLRTAGRLGTFGQPVMKREYGSIS